MEENISYVVCKLCGKKGRVLTHHIKHKHNLTRDEYIKKYDSPVVCYERQLIQIERNKELNKKLSTDPYYIELMLKVRRESGKKANPKLQKARAEYQKSERGKKRNSEIMRDLHKNHNMQQLATEGKLKSEKFKAQKREQIIRIHAECWKDPAFRDKVMSAAFDGSKKLYEDCKGNTVELRSTWELQLYNYFLEHPELEFEYENLKIVYKVQDKQHIYYPDFYLPKYNMVLEVKPKMYTTNKVNVIKREMVLEAGYKFEFVTEDELKDLNSFFHNKVLV